MFVVDVTEPLTLLLITIATVLLIFLGKELKKSYIPGMTLFAYLILVMMHCLQIAELSPDLYDVYYKLLVRCVAVDCVMIFISFISYLWVDDIASKFYKKKSIDNSLDWFWNKV